MAVRTVVANGLWSSADTWQGGNLPQAGDDVVHPSPYVVVLDINPPQLNSYSLNGTLLVRPTDPPKTLVLNSLSGSGNIDYEETSESLLAPFSLVGNAATPLDASNLTNFFSFYRTYFGSTQHYAWWRDGDFGGVDLASPTSKFFPKISSVGRVGGNVVISVTTPTGSAAAHYMSTNSGATGVPFLINVKHPTFPDHATILTPPISLNIQDDTTLVYPSAPSGFEGSVVVGGHAIIPFHTSLCPLILRNVKLGGIGRLVGAVLDENCRLAEPFAITFSMCFLLGGLGEPALRGDVVAFCGRDDTSVVLDVENLIWAAYKEET